MVSNAVGPAFCHAVTIAPGAAQLYAACGTNLFTADIDGKTGSLALRDASVTTYPGAVGGYGISRNFAWIPR